jgi:hypothetical protein
MNRKLALAGSLSAAVALVSGAVMVGTLLSAPPEKHASPDLAASGVDTDSSTVTSLDPVVVYQDEYEYVVTGGGATPVASAAGPAASDEVATAPQGSAAPAQTAAPAPAPAVTSPPVTAAPAPATTTTTRPSGVPRDWPADKPIPPKPAGCRDGQLEDNGVWNCQH